jgi:hypothetical protein
VPTALPVLTISLKKAGGATERLTGQPALRDASRPAASSRLPTAHP